MPFPNLFRYTERLAKFDLQYETTRIINENSEYLTNLLAIQLSQGKDADGANVTVFGKDYYSDRTVFEKTRHGSGLGKVTDRITNYMSGAFYFGLKVNVNGTRFVFTSDVPYFQDILTRSGTERVIQLNQEHLEQFRNEILIPQLKLAFNGL